MNIGTEKRSKILERSLLLESMSCAYFAKLIAIENHLDTISFGNRSTSLSKRNQDWNNVERIQNEPYFGWLENAIATYQNTLNIKTVSWENKLGLIPRAEIIEEDHPLQIDQKKGITMAKATLIVQHILKQYHK